MWSRLALLILHRSCSLSRSDHIIQNPATGASRPAGTWRSIPALGFLPRRSRAVAPAALRSASRHLALGGARLLPGSRWRGMNQKCTGHRRSRRLGGGWRRSCCSGRRRGELGRVPARLPSLPPVAKTGESGAEEDDDDKGSRTVNLLCEA